MTIENRQRLKYLLGDFVASNAGWLLFNTVRYYMSREVLLAQGADSLSDFLKFGQVVLGQIVLPLAMLFVYYLSGYYNKVFRKSRLEEFFMTFWSTLFSTLVIFFAVLINDMIVERMHNYELVLTLWGSIFVSVMISRLIITSVTKKMLRDRKILFNTLIVGTGKRAAELAIKILGKADSSGYNLIGFVSVPGENSVDAGRFGLHFYSVNDIVNVCAEHNVKELIIATENGDIHSSLNLINKLLITNLPLKLIPNLYNILLSKMDIDTVVGEPFINVSESSLSETSKNIKRAIDVFVSFLAIVILLPLMAVVAVMIKLTSPGPVFYLQERVGYHNNKFRIVKFRTMRVDAEKNGVPQLSSQTDSRITAIGRTLRKYRIDELPQFYNVLLGEMSLVGPRPERQYFIDKILEVAPYYALVHQVRPGITSLGMVKFGYAENVEEMVERLKYDLIYIENMSLFNDIKILVYTIKTVFTGRGV